MTLWLAFAAMVLVAVVFVLWRLKFPVEGLGVREDDLESNRDLYLEKMGLLKQQLDDAEISEEQFHALELEYKRQFLADNAGDDVHASARGGRLLVVVAAILIPLVAAVIYSQIGASTELKLRKQLEARSVLFTEGKGDTPEMAAATGQVIGTLNELAEKHPDDPTYHVLLARLYTDEGSFDLAIPHYVKATTILPEDGKLLAEYAQVLFFAAGNQVTDGVREFALKALQLMPMNQTALSLAGIASFNDGKYQQAIEYWRRAISLLPADSPSRGALESGVAAAQERLGSSGEQPAADQGRSLTVQVAAVDNLSVPADTTVFVYARTWQGSPMPLAIRKLQVSDLPIEVKLTEDMAMTPAMSLATVDQVEVVARISLSGSPVPAPGDYQASVGPVDVESQIEPITLSSFSPITQ